MGKKPFSPEQREKRRAYHKVWQEDPKAVRRGHRREFARGDLRYNKRGAPAAYFIFNVFLTGRKSGRAVQHRGSSAERLPLVVETAVA
jgi:hypothetical protein